MNEHANPGESAQPQLPPRPETYIDRTVERIKPGEDAVAVRYMDALEAENESLKARLMQVDDVLVVNWITVEDGDYREALHKLIKYNIAIHDDPAVSEVAANRKAERDLLRSEAAENARIIGMSGSREAAWLAERDKMLAVIREYRQRRGRYDHGRDCLGPAECGVVDDDRCPTCIKADALLPKEPKEEK